MNKHASKLQSTGLLASLFALLCLPCILAPILISAGLTSVLVFFGQWFMPILLVLVGISLIGFILSYRTHKNVLPLVLALISGGLLYFSINDQRLGYAGALLLVAAVIVDFVIRRRYQQYCDNGICEVKPKDKK